MRYAKEPAAHWRETDQIQGSHGDNSISTCGVSSLTFAISPLISAAVLQFNAKVDARF